MYAHHNSGSLHLSSGLLCSKHGPPIRTGAPTGTQVEAGGSIATTNRLSHYQEAGGWFAWTTPGSQVDASGRAHFSAAKTTASFSVVSCRVLCQLLWTVPAAAVPANVSYRYFTSFDKADYRYMYTKQLRQKQLRQNCTSC